MQELEKKVEYELLCRAERVKENRPPVELPPRNACEADFQLSGTELLGVYGAPNKKGGNWIEAFLNECYYTATNGVKKLKG